MRRPSGNQSFGRLARRASLAVLLATPPSGALAASDYEVAVARSTELEEQQRYAAAAAALDAIAADYPQDYALHLRRAWLLFNAEEYPRAEKAYRQALELSGGGIAPRLGLAWVALRQRQRSEALAGFDAVLRLDPDNASAREGRRLAVAMAALHLSPYTAVTLQSYSDQAGEASALALTAGVPVTLSDRLCLSARYRHIAVLASSSTLEPRQRGRQSSSVSRVGSQDELYATTGVSFSSAGVVAHYGYVTGSEDGLDRVHIGGLAGHLVAWGDLSAEASVSVYPSDAVYRLGVSWRSVRLGPFQIEPGAAVQRIGATTLAVASLMTLYSGDRLQLWLGGKIGDEERPTYLFQPAVYNISERISTGVWAGGRLRLSARWQVGLEAEIHNLRAALPDEPDSRLTLVSLVVSLYL